MIRFAKVLLLSVLSVSGVRVVVELIKGFTPEIIAGKDILQDYWIAQCLLSGLNPYSVSLGPDPAITYPASAHPPTAGLLFLPLLVFEPVAATAAWLAFELIALVAAVALLARAVNIRLDTRLLFMSSLVLLVWHPVYGDLVWGQLSLIQLPLLAGALWAFREGRWVRYGILVTLMLLAKPFAPLLLLPLLFKRSLSGILASGATAAVGLTLTLWRLGLDSHLAYLFQALPFNSSAYRPHVANISLWSLGPKVFGGTGVPMLPWVPTAPPLIDAPHMAQPLSVIVVSFAVGVGVSVAWRLRRSDKSVGVLVCTSILVSPIAWPHYMLFALIPLAQALKAVADLGFPPGRTNILIAVSSIFLLTYPELPMWTSVPAWTSLLLLYPVVGLSGLIWFLWSSNRSERLGGPAGRIVSGRPISGEARAT